VDYLPCQFGEAVELSPAFCLGLWKGVFDVNAIDKESGVDYVQEDAHLIHDSVLVPAGTLVPVCAMNMIFRRELIPAIYQVPMPVPLIDGWKIDRFGDIWGGFILKTLMDARGDRMSVGGPMVRHEKRRDFGHNLVQEHVGHLLNDEFVELVTDFSADGTAPYLDLLRMLTDHLRAGLAGASPMLRKYLDILLPALDSWPAVLEMRP
ncbi:MAG: hypothetical protein WA969_02440, partial [Candidatus Microthrix parvicella]